MNTNNIADNFLKLLQFLCSLALNRMIYESSQNVKIVSRVFYQNWQF